MKRLFFGITVTFYVVFGSATASVGNEPTKPTCEQFMQAITMVENAKTFEEMIESMKGVGYSALPSKEKWEARFESFEAGRASALEAMQSGTSTFCAAEQQTAPQYVTPTCENLTDVYVKVDKAKAFEEIYSVVASGRIFKLQGSGELLSEQYNGNFEKAKNDLLIFIASTKDNYCAKK